MTTRVEGERIRAEEQLRRIEDMVASVRIALRIHEAPIGFEPPQAILHAAGMLSCTLARLDAYQRAEDDAKGK